MVYSLIKGFSSLEVLNPAKAVWFLVGNGGMDYGDDYWESYGDYYRDPFPHSLLSTRHSMYLESLLSPEGPN